MKWISVEDRLPPKSDHKVTRSVMVWSSKGAGCAVIIAQGVMTNGVNADYGISHWDESFSGQTLITPVTHWMLLPPVPESDNE